MCPLTRRSCLVSVDPTIWYFKRFRTYLQKNVLLVTHIFADRIEVLFDAGDVKRLGCSQRVFVQHVKPLCLLCLRHHIILLRLFGFRNTRTCLFSSIILIVSFEMNSLEFWLSMFSYCFLDSACQSINNTLYPLPFLGYFGWFRRNLLLDIVT